MNYVEWLRVRNALRIYAIVLGALIVIALIVRISVNGQLSNNEYIVDHMMREPGTKISHSVVNGLNRTTLVNARERTTITIDDQNDGGKLIHIVRPATGHNNDTVNVTVGSVHVAHSRAGSMETLTFNTNGPVNVLLFLAIASFAGLIFATIWGCSFAAESQHLEYALLKPVTRTRYALGIVGVDLVGILLAGMMTIVAAIICQSMFEFPHFDFSGVAGPTTALLFMLPIAWYAMLNAATTSMRRGYGTIIGFAWPIWFVLLSLTHIPLPDVPVAHVFHTLFVAASRLVPLTYMPSIGEHGNAESMDTLSEPIKLAIVTGLMLIYGALALVQWRRVEA
jgi:hypothetical protein